MSRRPRVLVVEDDEEGRAEIARALPRDRYAWEAATSVDLGQGSAARSAFDAVVAGVDVDGLVLLDRIKRERPGLPVILVSATDRTRDAVEAIKRGAFHYLVRPLDAAELRAAVDEAIAAGPASSVACSGKRARDALGGHRIPPAVHAGLELVGSGPAMSRLGETIRLAASSSAPALITGESGVGKELVACAIHAESPRRGKPFVCVNASAIPADLLEAELFGHERGGFTGAAHARKGLLTEAAGGTLLLDEIGDMPLALQAKLLRVVQFGEVRPVGSDRAHRVDVRVIAATHRDLPRMVREGRFREDLYFRLHVLPVAVPALRERREDIPALVAHHLALARSRSPGSPVRSFAPGALEVLVAAPWPGNVRELASVIERLVVFGREEVVAADLVAFVHEGSKRPASTPPLSGPAVGSALDAAARAPGLHGASAGADRREQATSGRDPRRRPLHALPLAARSAGPGRRGARSGREPQGRLLPRPETGERRRGAADEGAQPRGRRRRRARGASLERPHRQVGAARGRKLRGSRSLRKRLGFGAARGPIVKKP